MCRISVGAFTPSCRKNSSVSDWGICKRGKRGRDFQAALNKRQIDLPVFEQFQPLARTDRLLFADLNPPLLQHPLVQFDRIAFREGDDRAS